MGMRRASFGVQDGNAEVQQAIHRIQPQEMNVAAMEACAPMALIRSMSI